MAYFLIEFEGNTYANEDLYVDVVAGGERAFIKMLASKKVISKQLFDQNLYLLTPEQKQFCIIECDPVYQDFDTFFRHLNIIPKKLVSRTVPGATTITMKAAFLPNQYKYRQVTFFKLNDYKEAKKYRMFANMAAIKICGRIYVALDAVDVQIMKPIIVTLKD